MADLILYAVPAFVLRLPAPGKTERVRYGLTQSLRTFEPHRVAFHEFAAIARDVRRADSWRHRLGYTFRGPGWSPDGRGGGTRG